MKASSLVIGLMGSKFTPANATEYMLRNALIEIDKVETENECLKSRVHFYNGIIQILKENAKLDKFIHSDTHYIKFDWIREEDEGFQDLLYVLGFELPCSEEKKDDELEEEEEKIDE